MREVNIINVDGDRIDKALSKKNYTLQKLRSMLGVQARTRKTKINGTVYCVRQFAADKIGIGIYKLEQQYDDEIDHLVFKGKQPSQGHEHIELKLYNWKQVKEIAKQRKLAKQKKTEQKGKTKHVTIKPEVFDVIKRIEEKLDKLIEWWDIRETK